MNYSKIAKKILNESILNEKKEVGYKTYSDVKPVKHPNVASWLVS